MKKTSLFLFLIILISVLIFRENNFISQESIFSASKTQFLISNPSWKVIDKDSNYTFQLTSKVAERKSHDDEFFIIDPLLEMHLDQKLTNSISSREAILKTDEHRLTMKSEVHLKLPSRNGFINLYTQLLRIDFKNKVASTEYDTDLTSDLFSLKGKGFKLEQSIKGEALLTFKEANFQRDNNDGYIEVGKADTVLLQEKSDVLILRGSAEIKLKSMKMNADEIKFNVRTKKIMSSKNSSIKNT